jgi:uncharacterized protein (DUF2062 family)
VKPSGTPPPASWWRRRVVAPILALLTQGITPDRIAFTLAVGTACSLFPFLGFTSLLNLGVGLWLRLNQPLLQVLNQLLGPLQLALILAYVRLGEWVWRAEGDRFSVAEMLSFFREANFGDFLQRFGWAGVHAFTAWALTSPVLVLGIHWSLRPVMRRLASKTRAQA